MGPKLQWVHELTSSVGLAMACQVTPSLEDHADPLKKLVVLTFADPMGKGDYQPLQRMVHGFARSNDCVVERIRRRGPKVLVLEVLIKNRLGPPARKNPLKEPG